MMSELKKIYVEVGPGDAYVLRGLLEAEGISAIVRGDDLSLIHISEPTRTY